MEKSQNRQMEGAGRPGKIMLLWGIRELSVATEHDASRDVYPTERTEREGDAKGTTNRNVVPQSIVGPDLK